MDRERIEKQLELIASAPDSQISKKITNTLKQLIGKPFPEIKTGVMMAMDYGCNYGLMGDYGMMALKTLHEAELNGTDADFNDENCPWRK